MRTLFTSCLIAALYAVVCLFASVWNTGTRHESVLPLDDEDVMTKDVEGWKELNTLAHYSVQDGSEIHLVVTEKYQQGHDADDDDPRLVHGQDGECGWRRKFCVKVL